jgi:hypothetical protein
VLVWTIGVSSLTIALRLRPNDSLNSVLRIAIGRRYAQ